MHNQPAKNLESQTFPKSHPKPKANRNLLSRLKPLSPVRRVMRSQRRKLRWATPNQRTKRGSQDRLQLKSNPNQQPSLKEAQLLPTPKLPVNESSDFNLKI
jgi:hypothetical protein